jgi:hypothetical protein
MQTSTPRPTSHLNAIPLPFVPLVGLPAVPNTRDTKDTKSSNRSNAPVASRGRPQIAEVAFQRCLTPDLSLEQAADWLKPLIERGVALTPALVQKLLPRVNGRDLNDKLAKKIIYAAEERSTSPSRRAETTYTEQLPAPAADGPEGRSSPLRKFHVERLGESNTFSLTTAERDGKGNPTTSRKTLLSDIRGPAALKANFFEHLAQLDESPRDATGHLRASHDRNAFPRTWSLEKIGRIVEEVLEKNEGNMLSEDSECRFKPMAVVEGGLPVRVFYRFFQERHDAAIVEAVKAHELVTAYQAKIDQEQGNVEKADKAFRSSEKHTSEPLRRARQSATDSLKKLQEKMANHEANLAAAYVKVREERRYYVATAFIENVVSAGSVENDQVDEANRLLTGITEASIREFMATNYKKENLWVTLAIAETVNANADRTCLTARDQEALSRAMSLLCVGESRHPRHQRLIDDTRRQFTMPDGWTR